MFRLAISGSAPVSPRGAPEEKPNRSQRFAAPFSPFPLTSLSLRRIARPFVRVVTCLLLIAAGGAFASAQTKTLKPGTAYIDPDKYVEFQPGALPIVLTSPHGGRSKPNKVADRTKGVLGADTNTQELTRAIQAEFIRRTGLPAHTVISLLHRSKLDPNREIKEAAQGDPEAEKAWHLFHNSIKAALRTAVQTHGFAFIIDIHGHGHEIQRLELGYSIDGGRFNQTDTELDRDNLGPASTLNDLMASGRAPSFAQLMRGPDSLGALLEARGFRSVPGPRDPGPKRFPYFNGGYISRTYARDVPGVDGVQIESHFRGVRATPEDRRQFAEALVDTMIVFLERHYRYSIVPAKFTPAPGAPAPVQPSTQP